MEQNVNVIDAPFTGDLVEDIKIAKRLIAAYPKVNLRQLMTIADDRKHSDSARIASIYTLGFTDDHDVSKAILARLAHDPAESYDIRDHATEALGYLTAR